MSTVSASGPRKKRNEWDIFISYRRNEAAERIAKWLKDELESEPVEATTGQIFHLDVFVDVTEPHHVDFQRNLVPILHHSRALIVLADEGSAKREDGEDYLYQELDWWATHRTTTPFIVVQLDPDSGKRLLSDRLFAKWGKVNCQNCFFAIAADSDETTKEKNDLIHRLRESIRYYGQIVQHDEVRRLKRRALVAALFALAALVAAGFAWSLKGVAQQRQKSAEESKRIALAQLRGANSSIETLTGFAESAGGRTRTERELLIEAANAYNRILESEGGDDPAFQFEKAWALNRLAQVSQRLEKFGFRPTGKGAATGVIDSSKEAETKARAILDALLKREPTSARYVDERGQNSMLKAMRILQTKDYPTAAEAIAAAIVDFETAIVAEPSFTMRRLHKAEAEDRLVTVLYAIPGRETNAASAVEQAQTDFRKLIETSSAQLGSDSIATLDYRMLLVSFKATQGHRQLAVSSLDAIPLLKAAFAEAYSIGMAYREHSRYERSNQAIGVAEDLAKTLFDLSPENVEDANRYAKTLNLRGDLLLSTAHGDNSQIQEAKESFQNAVEIYKRISGGDLSRLESDHRHLYAGVLHNLAEIYAKENMAAEALAKYDEAIEIQRRLVVERPDEMEYREFLRNHRLMRTQLLVAIDRKSEAQEEFNRLVTDAAADFAIVKYGAGVTTSSKKSLAKVFAKISEMSWWFGLSDTAIGACKNALMLLESIVTESKDELERFNVAVGYRRLAAMQRKVGAKADAKRSETRGADDLKKLVHENPTHTDYAKELQAAERQLNDADE